MTARGRVALVVLDGLGIGQAPDADAYGDSGSDTLGNVADAVGGLALPNLEALGLGCCRPLAGMRCDSAEAAYGIALPRSMGKDSITGHWELTGIVLERPFPTYPNGFPDAVISSFARATGREVLGNRVASGTNIIEELGPEQMQTGKWIVYTSADSVFQIAAHVACIPVEELQEAGRTAREILRGPHAVSRVITRPFEGTAGAFRRTPERRDYSVEPLEPTLLDHLEEAGVARVGVGKVDDLFAGRGIQSRHTTTNGDAYRFISEELRSVDRGLVFANVIEFDQTWGHRNDVAGFYGGLKELDRELPGLIGLLREEDLMILTADHGNDPTTESTDHSREAIPILVVGPRVRPVSIGVRSTFADVGATVAEYFGVTVGAGESFLQEILSFGGRN